MSDAVREVSLLPTINAIHPNAGRTSADVARELNLYTRRTNIIEEERPGSTGDRTRYTAEVRTSHDPARVSIDVRVLWQLLADGYRDGYCAARTAYALETTIRREVQDLALTPREVMAAALRHAGAGLRRMQHLYPTATSGAEDDAALNDVLAALHDLAFRLDPRGDG